VFSCYPPDCCQKHVVKVPALAKRKFFPEKRGSSLGYGHHLRQKLGGLTLFLVCAGYPSPKGRLVLHGEPPEG
jgi:hypothetical protein